MFNWNAPDGESLHQAALKYVDEIHYFDCKRSDRCISHWGLEGRVPLLDPEVIGLLVNSIRMENAKI